MPNEKTSQAGGGKSVGDSMQAGKEGGAPARTEDPAVPEGQQAEPAEQDRPNRDKPIDIATGEQKWPEPVDDPKPPRQTEIPPDAQHNGRPPHMNPSRPG